MHPPGKVAQAVLLLARVLGPIFLWKRHPPMSLRGAQLFFFWVAPLGPILLPPIVLETRFVSHGYF